MAQGLSENPGIFAPVQALAGDDDALRRQIVAALAKAQPGLAADQAALDREVTFRAQAIAVMTQLNTGAIDADYYDPTIGLHPRIDGTYVADATAPKQGQWVDGQGWNPIDPNDLWSPFFTQQSTQTAAQAMAAIAPFRGECAGALQISMFAGALAALGGDAFDKNNAAQALHIGPWDQDIKAYLQIIDVNAPAVPGDYFYFKNKDDYLKYAPNGFWQGLNCLYVGDDALGTRRYTGLGATFQSEAELRVTMANAYVGGCYPHRVEQPQTEIRFTVHARPVLVSAAAPPAARVAAMAVAPPSAPPPGARPSAQQLTAAGFQEHEPGVFVHPDIELGALGQALGFQPHHLKPTISAGLGNPSYRVVLDGTHCLVDYHQPDAARHGGDSRVRATVNLKAAQSPS